MILDKHERARACAPTNTPKPDMPGYALLTVWPFALASLPDELSFEAWREHFPGHAGSMEQRRTAFASTLAFIQAHNARFAAGETTFRVGVNQFSDLAPTAGKVPLTNQNRPIASHPPFAAAAHACRRFVTCKENKGNVLLRFDFGNICNCIGKGNITKVVKQWAP